MLPEELDRALSDAFAAQPAVDDRFGAVVRGGTRRRRRARVLTGAGLTSVVAVVGLLVAGGSEPDEANVVATGGGASLDVLPCPGSVLRRVDGGDPGADALPPLESAATDRRDAEAVLERRRNELTTRYDAARITIGPGFGRAWAGVNGGAYDLVDVDDVALLVEVRDIADCPTGASLHTGIDGVPLFFFFEPDLRVEPSTDLVDGQTVSVSGPFEPGDVAGAGQCAVEGLASSDPTPWCDLNVARTDTSFTVVRTIETSHGLVDCTERPGRCVIGIRTGNGDLVAPISFDPSLGPVPTPTIELDRTSVEDGGAVVVRGRDFTAGAEVYLTQCTGEVCDQARASRVTADTGGVFESRFLAYGDIQTGADWQRCDPCTLTARSQRQPPAVAPLDVTGPASRPTVRIVPGPPYRPGQRVVLEGTAFQAGTGDVTIGWCAFRTDRPDIEVQGDAANGFTSCVYPEEGFTAVVDDAGRFRIGRFPLPDLTFACQTAGTRCGLAWHPSEGSIPVFVTPVDLSG